MLASIHVEVPAEDKELFLRAYKNYTSGAGQEAAKASNWGTVLGGRDFSHSGNGRVLDSQACKDRSRRVNLPANELAGIATTHKIVSLLAGLLCSPGTQGHPSGPVFGAQCS